ncbi:MAG TPA: NAD(P)-dependent oxidoreductase [Candidatus Sulfotelmatobacter sp.]|nr:NAD(P)-dependent oxidoreductase [Candidatus Sulfotelmatobacter sp.]
MSTGFIVSPADKILVTGSNGFIGARVVENLLARGYFNLRCFVRPSSKLKKLQTILARFPAAKAVELVSGDLLSREDCARAVKDASVLIHLAAGFDKSFAGAFMNSALATRNLLDAFLESGRPRRFVNVSSFAVYSNLHLERHALLDENCPLETEPQARNDAYGFGKLKQEQLVREYGAQRGLKWVILRPGMVYGPGKPDLSGRVGINTFGFFIHMGGSNELPMTFVDNCAEAIVLAALKPGVDGEIFNVVDDERLPADEFLARCKAAKNFFSVPAPYPLVKFGCALWEDFFNKRQGQLPPVFNRRRCAAEWGGNTYTNEKLRRLLGWSQKISTGDAMKLFTAQYK